VILPRSQCPSREELSAYSLGELSEERLQEIAGHVEGCAGCEEALRALDGVMDGVISSLRTLAQAPSAAAMPAAVPQRIGKYEILSTLGVGGMGIVFKARDIELGREVALKKMLGGRFAREDYRQRFLAEARALARLQHPHIVQIHDFGEHEGQPYFVLEYVPGGSLSDRLAGKPQPPVQAARWAETLARAVQYAHDQGIIHRDLKPSNVLLTLDDQPRLCDFGLAKLLESSDLRTRSGVAVGTPEYMAPEQTEGPEGVAGPAADLYGLGAVLYTLLTGRPPFRAASELDTVMLVRTQEPVRPGRLQPTVPSDLDTICLKCLEKEPRRRYPSALALAEDLRRFLAGEPIQARPVGALTRTWKWAKRRPALAGLILTVALAFGLGLPAVTLLWRQAEAARQNEAGARREEQQARRQAEKTLYFSRLALAHQHLENDHLDDAVRLLEACPAGLRGWEWYYLDRQAHAALFTLLHKDGEHEQSFWAHDLSFCPDGRHVAVARGLPGGLASLPADAHFTTPGNVEVWDVIDGKLEKTLKSKKAAVLSVASSLDGRSLAWGCVDGSAWLADVESSKQVPVLEPGPGGMQCVRFAPDSKWLAVSRRDRIVLWDMAACKRVCTWPLGVQGTALVFGLDGGLYISSPGHPLAHLGRGGEGVREVPIPGLHDRTCAALAIDRDGGRLALAPERRLDAPDAHRILIWDLQKSRLVADLVGHRGPINRVAFGPGDLVASGSEDGTVRLWNPKSAAQEWVFQGHPMGVTAVAFSPDGQRLVSASKDGSVRVWDVRRDPRGLHFPALVAAPGEAFGHLAFAADNHSLIVVQKAAGPMVRLWDAWTGQKLEEHALTLHDDHANPARAISLSAFGKRLACRDATDENVVKVWDTPTGAELAVCRGHTRPLRAAALSPDGRRLASAAANLPHQNSGRDPVELLVWDVASAKVVQRLSVPALWIDALAFSPEGHRLAASVRLSPPGREQLGFDSPAEVLVWDLSSGDLVCRIGNIQGMFPVLAFNPAGDRLAGTGYHAETIYVWEVPGGKELFRHSAGVLLTSAAYSPDGRRLAITGFDGRVTLLDADSGLEALTLHGLGPRGTGHYNFTARAVFSPDGRRLAANDWDGTVTVWDAGEKYHPAGMPPDVGP
jgi:WD40 repeat protein/tRNA A-37 threonylcarbamoyl transferase component Bud32